MGLQLNSSWHIRPPAVAAAVFVIAAIAMDVLHVSSGPRVWMTATSSDIGSVLPGTVASSEFTICNSGGGILILSDAETTCGCTGVDISQLEVSSGDSSVVRVTLRVPMAEGAVQQAVSISTNDPECPTVRFLIYANATWSVVTDTKEVVFENLASSSASVRFVRLRSVFGAPFNITAATSSASFITMKHSQGDATSHLIEVRCDPDAPCGLNESIWIGTNLDGGRSIRIDVRGNTSSLLNEEASHCSPTPAT